MSVKLRKRKNADGSITLRLDVYHNGSRSVETLKHLKLAKVSNVLDREHNKKRLQQAEEIAVMRAAELQANHYNITTDSGKKTEVIMWMQSYINSYSKKDKRNMQGALNRFSAFLKTQKKAGLTFGNLSALIVEDFIEFLETNSTGEGANSYFSRFKKMTKQAYRYKLMKENVLDFVDRKVKGKAKKKDVLTLNEIRLLNKASIENIEIKKAFLFTCFTGLRWIDIKALKWNNINLIDRQLKFIQSKTAEDILIPLNDAALKLLGVQQPKEKQVFALPSANGANKTLKAWVKRAGINKSITWHNGRHSFGTNLIFNDVDIFTTSKLLGHTSLKHTHRYVEAAQEMKEHATQKINIELE